MRLGDRPTTCRRCGPWWRRSLPGRPRERSRRPIGPRVGTAVGTTWERIVSPLQGRRQPGRARSGSTCIGAQRRCGHRRPQLPGTVASGGRASGQCPASRSGHLRRPPRALEQRQPAGRVHRERVRTAWYRLERVRDQQTSRARGAVPSQPMSTLGAADDTTQRPAVRRVARERDGAGGPMERPLTTARDFDDRSDPQPSLAWATSPQFPRSLVERRPSEKWPGAPLPGSSRR